MSEDNTGQTGAPDPDGPDVVDEEDMDGVIPDPGPATLPEVVLNRAWLLHTEALAMVDDAVARAREQGLTWVQIGRATGMTRQSARERWNRP